jgi:hypothetical protein
VNSQLVVDRLAAAQRTGHWSEIDPLLVELQPCFGPDLVAPLLLTLVDDISAEAQVFGIVHLAESADDRPYALGLVKALPLLVEAAPRWATILLSRLLNSASTFQQLIELVPSLPAEQQRALLKSVAAVEEWRPDQVGPQVALIRKMLNEKAS